MLLPIFVFLIPLHRGKKFDGNGEYTKKWIPSLSELPKKWVFKPVAPPDLLLVSDVFLGNNYPFPCVDHKEGRSPSTRGTRLFKTVLNKIF